MRIHGSGLLLAGVLAACAVVPPVSANAAAGAEQGLSLGLDARYFDYEEPGLMEEDGMLYGIAGSYVVSGNMLVSEFNIEYLQGELDYDGSTWGGTPLKTDNDDWLVEARYLLGRKINLAKGVNLTPFAGVGYRNWNDDIGGSGGYERNVVYWYSPVGLKLSTPLAGLWSLGIKAEYDIFWRGKVKSHLSDVDPGYNDPEVDQDAGDGYGVRLTATIERPMGPQFALAVEPYVHYWEVDESNREVLYYYGSAQNYIVEPDNETLSMGCRLKLLF